LARIDLTNETTLFVKDYLFLDGSRKYAFHWQTAEGDCLIRWDNAPHHQDIDTFPYHRHLGTNLRLEASSPMNLAKVLTIIRDSMADEKNT
jgi:hypothetical protein